MSPNGRWKVALLLVLVSYLFAGILPIFARAGEAAVVASVSAIPDHITLTWSQDPKTTQTITWRTDLSVSNGRVQYAKQSEQTIFPVNAQSVDGTVSEFSTNTGKFNIHSATISGLDMGAVYVYRVGDGTNWSDPHTFTTEAANMDGFKFLVFGDSQSGKTADPNYGPWRTCVQNAFKANPDARFLINMGDLVETGQDYNHWENWFAAAKGVIDTIPEMAVEGNHETYMPPDNATSGRPAYWTTQFKLPGNGPDGLIGQTYSYDYGNVHFSVLDSQQAEEAAVNGDILAAQEAWLKNDLASTSKTWKIVLFHKTPYYNKASRSNENIKSAFGPILDQYHVDVVFNGHDHGLARTYPMYNDQFMDSIAKGTVYYVTGRSGNKSYPDLSQKIWNAFFYDPQDHPMYIAAAVIGNTLILDAVKADGTVIDHYVMDKNADMKLLVPTFHNTRLVIWGNMLQPPQLKASPAQIQGKWYVSFQSFVQFVGGVLTPSDARKGTVVMQDGVNRITTSVNSGKASVNGKTVELPDKFIFSDGQYLISADSLKTLLGFAWKYDSAANILYFAK